MATGELVKGAVVCLVQRRLARRWPAWIGVGVLLGMAFGLSLASFNAARRTTSAYDRILREAEAPDATIAHSLSPAEAEVEFAGLEGVLDQRHYLGFVGYIEGVDRALVNGLLAPEGVRFPVELPQLRAGRLPDPARAGEVFVNSFLADRAGLELGQRLEISLFAPDFASVTTERVTVVGIGTLPREAVADETAGSGIVVFSPAFTPTHRHLMIYASTSIDLAPGVDARRDVAPRVGALGYELSEARSQEKQAVSDALRPMITVLLALGVLAFVAASVAAGQVIQRDQERWRTDNETLRALGMVRAQVVFALLATAGLIAVVAVATAVAVMAATSPVAPVGPLHELDPGRGVVIELTVAVAGAVAVLLTIGVIAGGLALLRRPATRPVTTLTRTLATSAQRPAARAGLTLALGGDGRRRPLRSAGFATVAVALTAVVVTLVVSAVALTGTPSRYGFDWDVLAVNPYGDQTEQGLQAIFGDDPDVVSATGFTAWTFLVDGRAVPGLAATPVKGELGPTILRGRGLRTVDDIVVGQDTLDRLGVGIGDRVQVQVAGYRDGPPIEPATLRVVGVATFAPVSQAGTDQPRLGTGSLITRDAFDRMIGYEDDDPEWTAVRLAGGVEPAAVIARHPEGVPDAMNTPTTWYTDAKPAELRQLDSARSLLLGAIVMSALIAVAVIGHGLWTQTRANRRDLSVLVAIGFTRRQLSETAAWQAAPLAVIVTVIGIPLGIVLGRWSFSWFARSLAVVDRTTIPTWVVGALVVGALAASAIGALGAIGVARKTQATRVLREE